MRVSNTVKDYIRSEIEKKYPIENLPEYEDASSRISKFEDEVRSKLESLVDEAKATFLASNPDIPEYVINIYKPHVHGAHRRRFVRPQDRGYERESDWELEENNDKHCREIYKKQEDAFNKIVVALELGGTKADLERMLEEL